MKNARPFPRGLARALCSISLVLMCAAALGSCGVDPHINATYGCDGCMNCVRGFCLDAIESVMPDAALPPVADAGPSCSDAGVAAGGGCACSEMQACPSGQMCCAGACALRCPSSCGDGVVDALEQCDGSALCSKACSLLFDSSLAHRYSFAGKGKEVLDTVGGANGATLGAMLPGTGDLPLGGGTSDEYVNLPNGLLRGSSGATFEVWLTWTGGAGEHVFDFGFNTSGEDKHTGVATTYLYLCPQDDKGNVAAHANFTMAPGDVDKDIVVRGSGALSKRVLHQVVIVFDGVANQLELHVDGAFVDRVVDVKGMLAQIDDRNVWLGRSNSPGNSFKGTLHEFRIYGRPLKPDAIRASFEAGVDPTDP